LLTGIAVASSGSHAENAPALRAVAVDDETRVRRGDRDRLLAVGHDLSGGGAAVNLQALRGETVAFQVIVLAPPSGPAAVSLALPPFAAAATGNTGAPLVAQIFREHFVTVAERSRNQRRPNESLGWLPGARPPDEAMLGAVPDALIPVGLSADVPGAPEAPNNDRSWNAFWIDLFVPESATPGRQTTTATAATGAASIQFSVTIDVGPTRLPYRAVSAFAYYEPARLDERIGDGPTVERQLWQLLHEHHVDALAPLTAASDVDRLADAFTGSLFSPAAGYVGPGTQLAPAVIALGAYGQLGDPTPAATATVREMVQRLASLYRRPALADARPDLFLYAIDEDCRSPRAGAWKSALAAPSPQPWPVAVGQTCGEAPEQQAADVALVPGQLFRRAMVDTAAHHERRAWIYNGALPQTGTLLLDAEPRGLTANGWIAALTAIDRWFYWESTFWNDDNRGGRGAIDPFATPVNFHNRDGDTALGDGLLVYPGRQRGAFAGHSWGFAGVFPSLRLKMLRRGIQDAGYLALAAREHPDQAARIAARAVPAMLDEAPPDQGASWDRGSDGEASRFFTARAALRALISREDSLTTTDGDRVLHQLARQRRADVAPALSRRQRLLRIGAAGGAAGVALVVIVASLLVRHRRRRGPNGAV
jgi:hypothetical protein